MVAGNAFAVWKHDYDGKKRLSGRSFPLFPDLSILPVKNC